MSRRTAAFFDLDKTIIATSSAAAFIRPLYAGGLLSRRALARSVFLHLHYMLAGADARRTEQVRDNLSSSIVGWDVATVRQIVSANLHRHIDPYVYAEAVELIDRHHAHGEDVVIVSASGTELVGPIAQMLGADHVICTRMTVVDGRYTGGFDFYAYGEHKAEAIKELARTQGYDLSASHAYSDSSTDIPMLSIVGHPHAVNPDHALRQHAMTAGWPVRTFANPVGLRARVPQGTWRAYGIGALAAVALGWGLRSAVRAWRTSHRRTPAPL